MKLLGKGGVSDEFCQIILQSEPIYNAADSTWNTTFSKTSIISYFYASDGFMF